MTLTRPRIWIGHGLALLAGIAAALILLLILSLVLGLVATPGGAWQDGASWVVLGLGMQTLALSLALIIYRRTLGRVTGIRLDRDAMRAAAMLAFGGSAVGFVLIYKGIVTPREAVPVLLAVWFAFGGWLLERHLVRVLP